MQCQWCSHLTWYSTKHNTFILKCFLQFACTNLDGSQKEGVNFLNLHQKEEGNQKGVVPSEKGWRGGSNPGRKYECCITNISNMFLAQCWRLATNSRPFDDNFIKMTIGQDLAIFNSWYLPFLNVPYSPLKKLKHWNLDILVYDLDP